MSASAEMSDIFNRKAALEALVNNGGISHDPDHWLEVLVPIQSNYAMLNNFVERLHALLYGVDILGRSPEFHSIIKQRDALINLLESGTRFENQYRTWLKHLESLDPNSIRVFARGLVTLLAAIDRLSIHTAARDRSDQSEN